MTSFSLFFANTFTCYKFYVLFWTKHQSYLWWFWFVIEECQFHLKYWLPWLRHNLSSWKQNYGESFSIILWQVYNSSLKSKSLIDCNLFHFELSHLIEVKLVTSRILISISLTGLLILQTSLGSAGLSCTFKCP